MNKQIEDTRQQSREALMESVLAAISKDLPNAQQQQLTQLATQFYRRVPLDELESKPVEHLLAVVSNFLDFMRLRTPGQPDVRIFNPDEEEHGWSSGHSVIEIVNNDMPFLVDSVTVALGELELAVHQLVHPVVRVLRDAGGHILQFAGEDQGQAESLMHILVDRQSDPEQLHRIQTRILDTLAQVRRAVEDWRDMRAKASEVAAAVATESKAVASDLRAEAQSFVQWLAEDHFTFLGFRDYELLQQDGKYVLRVIPGSGLGILREVGSDGVQQRELNSLSGGAQTLTREPQPVIVTKTNTRCAVHRVGYMDYIGVLRYDDEGRVIGERRFLGLFTSGAYYRSAWDTPLVRPKVEAVMAQSGLRKSSHAWKAMVHILETLPRDELFQSNIQELYELAMGILLLQERQRTKLFIREEQFGRFYSCMVFIPRDRFNTEVRESIQSILKRALKGDRLDYVVQVSESVLARLHVVVRPRPGEKSSYDVAEIEAKIVEAVRSWQDELQRILVSKHGEENGLNLSQRYGSALPLSYVEDVSPWVAGFDVENVAALKDVNDLRMSLYRPRKKRVGLLRFKLFKYGQPIPLSDVLPMLENLGLHIVNERPYELILEEKNRLWIQDFDMLPAEGEDLDIDAVKEPFQQAFEKIWRGHADSDGFNQLILACHLDWRQVAVIRAYSKYLLQTGMPFSQAYMEETLQAHPLIARLLVELFQAQFDIAREDASVAQQSQCAKQLERVLSALQNNGSDPLMKEYIADVVNSCGDREAHIEAIEAAVIRALEQVKSRDQDLILRAFMQVMKATLRTNYYCTDSRGEQREYMSFKLDSSRVPDLPKPRPYREIWVFSPRMEGVHLRMGKVARGGLRWSDRKEDFRTEVLGLMKAQNVKNTMIVPLGAKGGFVVKHPPVGGTRDEILAEGIYCYRSFINGLLDITDNLDEDELVPPRHVIRRDGDDPYLVVAADKGTATFSDIANSISAEHDFWLGDAFASGGSVGYDHKGMGITAKGAWESVKRHFREIGIDTQSQEFSVVGVGDMGGDVFGNGMLLSPHLKLLAAFNHLHIFLDPDPDPAVSFEERKRLFDLPRSSWEDYQADLISKGGGIYSRQEKSITLTPQVQAMLDVEEQELSPPDLIRAILKAPVDLLWNGGIGTYVKAGSESHADVGDASNSPLRIDGRELRCKVVGEGGNLGFTQLGRIEYAQHGGRINTDFIDNSAGVDCSDHEVNIKILLNLAISHGQLTLDERNALLAEMTAEVSELVLRSNYLQAQAITMMESLTGPRLGAKAHFISVLEKTAGLDRGLEFLPDEEEIKERQKRGQGLTRPELSVLLSYAKITLYQDLLASNVPEDPYLSRELIKYFPQPLHSRFDQLMPQHRLWREIIATMVTNSMVNRMGASFALRMHEDSGASYAEVAKAYTIAREVLGARDYWDKIELLDNQVDTQLQTRAELAQWNLLRHTTRWLLNQPGQGLKIEAEVKRFRDGVKTLKAHLPKLLVDEDQQRIDSEARCYQDGGVPQEFALEIASQPHLAAALDIVDESNTRSLDVMKVAEVYFGLGERMNLKWLYRQVESLPVEGQWHAHARGNLRDELLQQQRALAGRVLAGMDSGSSDPVADWVTGHGGDVARALEMLQDMRDLPDMDYATVSVAIRALEQLVLSS